MRENNWIRLRNSDVRDYAKAQPLADLLRENKWDPNYLKENPSTVNLMDAIGIAQFDMLRAFVATSEEERKVQDDIFTEILAATGGDLDPVREFVQDIENDEGILDHLAERREQRKIVQANHRLGQRVEDLVKESLECKGFTVHRKPIGSDFEIEYDLVEDDKEIGIEVTRNGQSWLVEVKATRDQNQGVRMTAKQGETAVAEGDRFLLCVVPVDGNAGPELETVSTQMRFARDIGPRVASLCRDLATLRELKDDIGADESSGVQLKIDPVKARIHVARSVWEEGIELRDLAKRLLA